ncbi:uncharacterized protein VP01_1679g5 [Puccinia sorghi]|uniref:Retrotransposon gag domain-containing protein n=1 Tax=Puccinia sorghi TaxID=27349 RepID=A0A0L6VGJ9_9BASI|nr:uncharacterized protein VP01_1679g5 [Puccinia sorghi]
MDALNARLDKARLEAQQHPVPAPVPNPIKLAKPQPLDGTRSTAYKVFVSQIALHLITYLECFPIDTSKVAFTTSFMQDCAATWCQPYLNQMFNGEPLDWTDFLKDLEASFFDHNRQQRAEVALQNIHQTGTVSNYTQDFNQNALAAGWPNTPLISLYQGTQGKRPAGRGDEQRPT